MPGDASRPDQRRTDEPSRLPSLDLLRGLSILGVIAVHTAAAIPTGIGPLDSVLAAGRFGVQLFFFVSAYTMCYMWQKRQGEATPVRNFYLRRFLRIAPLFWLAIAFYFALSKQSLAASWTQLLLSSSFLHGFFPQAINAIVPGGWSIAVEMSFYAFFPLLIIRFSKRRQPYLLLAIAIWILYTFVVRSLLLSLLSSSAIGHSPAAIREFLYLIFPNQAPVFLLGCYLYHLLAACQFPSRFEQLLLGCWLAFSLAAGLISGEGHLGFAAVYLGLAAAVYATVRARAQLAPLQALGRQSYAIYLSHFWILAVVAERLPCHRGLDCLAVAMILTTSLSYGVALLIHRLIEAPINRFTRQLTGPNPS